MKEDFDYGYYLVAFIDVLGQKEAFQGINELPKNEEEKGKLIKAHEQTVWFVENFREGFKGFHEAFTEVEESHVQVPESKKEQFDEMRKSSLKYRSFSDCIQAFVSLQTQKYHSPCIRDAFGVLGACGGMLLVSLACKKTFRAGIDVGVGTELGNGEVYGPGFFNAYTLESKIAQYPRIVIGDHFIHYLNTLSKKRPQLTNQTPEDIALCKFVADNCLEMIVQDLDGYNILDYLGDNFQNNYYKALPDDDRKELTEEFKKAFDFVESEYKKRKKARNSKLALRYFMLRNYFKSRRKFWM